MALTQLLLLIFQMVLFVGILNLPFANVFSVFSIYLVFYCCSFTFRWLSWNTDNYSIYAQTMHKWPGRINNSGFI